MENKMKQNSLNIEPDIPPRNPRPLPIPVTLLLTVSLTLAALVPTSCAPGKRPVNIIRGQQPAAQPSAEDPARKKPKKNKVVWVQNGVADADAPIHKTTKNDHLMNFDAISPADFIEAMMSGVFKRNYLITDAVRNMSERLTIKMTEDLSREQAFSLFTQLLALYNVEMTQRENTCIFDVSKKTAVATFRGPVIYGRRLPDMISSGGGEEITVITPFYNITPGALKGILTQQLPSSAVVYPLDPLNLLVLNGNSADIRHALAFIDILDRAQFKDKSIIMISPDFWDAGDFAAKISELLNAEGIRMENQELSRGLVFIPVEKLNSLVVISPVREWAERVLYWLEKLDIPAAAGEAKKVFIYKIKNIDATAAYDILQSYSQGTVPGLAQSSGRSALADRISGGDSSPGDAEPKETKPPASTISPSAIRTNAKSPQDGDKLPEVAIIPVMETNSIVMIASPVKYKKYLDILNRIDVPRQQVFVEVIIGEVSLDDTTQLGLEFWINRYLYNTQFGTKGGLGVYKGQDSQGNTLVPRGSNFFVNGILEGSKFEVLINALVDNSKINIISTPKVTVVENEEAEISVGSDVPVIASESAIPGGQTGTSYIPFRSVQYINTGIILKVKASVLADNKISLELEQEVSEALENKKSDISSPEILKRKVKTTLIVTEGEIAFIGGLFQKKVSTSGAGIPVLSQLPLLGNLFKRSSRQTKKTELVVFINARTIRKNSDMQEIVEGVRRLFSDRLNISMEPLNPPPADPQPEQKQQKDETGKNDPPAPPPPATPEQKQKNNDRIKEKIKEMEKLP